ncbi:MAG: UPF0149 family protein [Gemmatimonadales bacterium]
MSLSELRGFLFAVVCAPRMIVPSEWLPLVFGDGEIEYESMKQAERVFGAMMELYNETNEGILRGRVTLPDECRFQDDIMANLEDDAPIAHWSRGFALGHDWLRELWDGVVSTESDEDFGAVVANLLFFSSPAFAQGVLDEIGSADLSLEDYASLFRKSFTDSMSYYALLGRDLGKPVSPQPRQRRPGRNEPCPCGSGKKFKNCCGAILN